MRQTGGNYTLLEVTILKYLPAMTCAAYTGFPACIQALLYFIIWMLKNILRNNKL